MSLPPPAEFGLYFFVEAVGRAVVCPLAAVTMAQHFPLSAAARSLLTEAQLADLLQLDATSRPSLRNGIRLQ
jgi:hypothetical protein